MLTRNAIGALVAACWLAGCSEPPPPKTFVLWEIKDVYAGGRAFEKPTSTSVRQVEGGLDRVACELIQTKQQQTEEAFQARELAHRRDLARLGLPASTLDWTRAVYRCLPTGGTPEAAPAS